jgi:hypothetical protein
MSQRLWLVVLCFALPALIAGCSRERTFSADDFVTQVKEEGVELHLGDELVTTDEGKKLYAVSLAPLPGSPASGGSEGVSGLNGSLAVYDGTDGADTGMQSCTASGDLLCYQASNILVIIEGNGIEAQRLGVAIEKLADD